MNKAYRLIWSRAKEAWVVVSEKVAAKGGPRAATVTLSAALLLAAGSASALPTGSQIVSGTVGITTSGSTMTVTNSANAIINWQAFSIANGETTRFVQPSALSAVLNRVTGGDPSKILGTLQSNGKVLLINPSGIIFGAGSRVDVNGLIASSLDIANQDFLAGRMKFAAGPMAGKVENQGTITTPSGGSVYLIAPDVQNSGVITAPNGDVLLAAGKEVLLVDSSNPEIAMVVTAPDGQSINLGTIVADAGRVGMYGSVVRQKGRISANSAVQDASGRIFLKATKEVTLEKDSLTSATGTKGGTVQVLGQHVGLLDNAVVDVSGTRGGGTVLVGGDYQGKNPLVLNADATYFGKDATIKADATNTGNGGKVIIWADDTTRAYGSISAKGGSKSGDGGFIEVSGKNSLDFVAKIDATAPNGILGTLLLDPANIDVSNTNPTAAYTDVNLFTAQTGTDQVIAPATLAAVGASVDLQATLNITFTDALTLTTPGAGLTALAGGVIAVNAPITTAGGVINLTANEAAHGTGLGSLSISPTGGLNTTGSSTPTGANINLKVDSGSMGDITLAAPINAGTAGNVSLITIGAITQTAAISAAKLDATAGSGISIASAINTVGNISITGTGAVGQDGIIVSAPITTTSGNITLDGTGGDAVSISPAGRGVVITGGTISTNATVGTMSSGNVGTITIIGTGGKGFTAGFIDDPGGAGGNGIEIAASSSITTSNTITGAVSGGNLGTITLTGAGGLGGAGGTAGKGGSGVLIDDSNITSSNILSGGTISGGTVGNITIAGSGAAGGAASGDSDMGPNPSSGGFGGDGIYVSSNSNNVTISGSGDISLTGIGSDGGAATPTMGVNAIGGNGGFGINIKKVSVATIDILSTSGLVTMNGTGGTGGVATGGSAPDTGGWAQGGNGNLGINLDSATVSSNPGAGAISLTGIGGAGGIATGGAGTDNNPFYGDGGSADGGFGADGISLKNSSSITTGSGNINLIGTGGASGNAFGGAGIANSNYGGYATAHSAGGGISIDNSTITSNVGGVIALNGTAGAGGIATGGTGPLVGGDAEGGNGGGGIYFINNSQIETSGNISLGGTASNGGAATGGDGTNLGGYALGGYAGTGVRLSTVGSSITSTAGNITITGVAGYGGEAIGGSGDTLGTSGGVWDVNAEGGRGENGIYADNVTIQSTVGTITMNGTAGHGGNATVGTGATTSADAKGGDAGDTGIGVDKTTFLASNGITITGIGSYGGDATGENATGGYGSNGIWLSGAYIHTGTGGAGNITLNGTAGNGGVATAVGNATGGAGGHGIFTEFYDISTLISTLAGTGSISMTAAGGYGGAADGTGTVTNGNGGSGLTNDSTAAIEANSSTGTVTLNSTNDVNIAGTVAGKGLELLGSGNYDLSASNQVGTITGNLIGNLIFNNNGNLIVGSGSTGISSSANISLTASGAITQTNAISGNLLTTNSVGGTNLSLANNVTKFSATNTGSGNIALTDTAASLDIAGINQAGGGSVSLNASGAVAQATSPDAALIATALELLGPGSFELTNASNAISTLAGNTTGSVDYHNNGALTIGTVNSVGLTSSNLALTTNGALTDSAGATITTNNLTVNSAGGIVLDANHAVSSFSATNITSGGITFINTKPTLTVGTVTQSGSLPTVIENTGNISLGLINGGSNVVTLRAHTGAITDNNSDADNVINAFRTDFNDGFTTTPTGVGTVGDALEIYNAAVDSKVTAQTNSGGIYIEKTAGSYALDLQGITHTGNTTGDIVIKGNAGIINSAALVTSAGNNGNVTLQSVGGTSAVAVNAAINKAGTGTLTLQSDTGANIDIAGNIFGNAGDVVINAGNNINVATGSISGNNLVFSAGNSITDPGVITANTLKVSAGSHVSLTGANMVNIFAAAPMSSGNLDFYNNKLLTIGTASGTNGIDFSNNPFGTIIIKTTTGDLTVAQPVNAGPMGGGQITLEAAGALNVNSAITSSYNATPSSIRLWSHAGGITSTAAGIISGNLEAKTFTTGNISLDQAPNVVPVLSASVANGGISFKNAGNLSVGYAIGFSGVTASGDVSLLAGGTITQTYPIISAGLLTTNSVGGTTLNNASNAVAGFTAINTTSGNIELTNTAASLLLHGFNINQSSGGDVTISNSGAINTIGWVQTAGNGAISLAATGGTATIGNSLIAGDGTGTGGVSVTATGATSDILLNTVNVYSGATGGGSGGISLTAGRDIKLNPAELKTTGYANLQSGRSVLVNGPISAGNVNINAAAGGDVTGTGIISSANINLQYLSGTSVIGASGTPLLTSGTSNFNIGMSGSGPSAVYVSHTGNATLGMVYLTANAPFSFLSSGDLTASLLATGTGDLTLKSSTGTLSLLGTLSGGNIFLQQSNAAAFNLGQAVSATGNVQLSSGGAVTQAAPITAAGLELLGAGSYTLTNSGNTITTLAGNTTGTIDFYNAGPLAIGTVNTVGLTSTNTINLTATAAITQSQKVAGTTLTAKTLNDAGAAITLTNAANAFDSVNLLSRNAADGADAAGNISYRDTNGFDVASAHSTGAITLQNAGAVTQSGAIIATGLELLGSDNYTLTNAANDISVLAGAISGSGLQYADANGFSVGTVGTVGLTVASGDIALKAGSLNSLLTISENVLAPSGNVTYVADNLAHNAFTTTSGSPSKYVEVKPFTASTAIEFSAAADAAGYLRLSSSEMNFSTPLLKVGNDTNTGGIAIKEAVAPVAFNTLSLITGGTISQSAGSTITIAGLNADGWGGVTLNEANAISYLGGHTDSNKLFAFTDTIGMTVKQVDVQNGINSPSGNIVLTSAAAITNDSSAIISTGGVLTANAASGINLPGNNAAASAILNNSTSGNVSYEANLPSLSVSAANALTGAITVKNTGGSLVVGNTATGSGSITLTGSGSVTLATATTSGPVNVTSTGGAIVDNNGGALNITGGVVALNASTGIAMDVTASTSVAAQSTSGNISLTSPGNMAIATISTPGTLTLISGGTVVDTNGASLNISVNGAFLSSYSGIGTTGDPLEMQVSTLNASSSMAGGVYISNTGPLNITGMSAMTGDLWLDNSGALSVSAPISGNNITLHTSGSFTNSSGAGALTASGRWLVWSADPSADTRGGLTYGFKQYNAQFGVTTVLGSGNGFLYSLAPTVSASLTGSVTKIYDGTTAATLNGSNYSVSGAIDGDTVLLNNPVSGSFDNKNVGSGKTITVSGISVASASNGAAQVYGYGVNASANSVIGAVTAKALTVSATGNNKVYDGNTTTTVVLADNRISGDLLTVSNSAASFIDKNAASGKTVNVSGINVSGTDAGNYTFNTATATTADITAKALTVSATGNNKVYDGNTTATVVLADNRISGDLLTVSSSAASFIDKNAASGKTVNVSGIAVSGTDAGNYTFNTSAATSADITAKALTVSATGNNKVYDGNTTATVVLADNRISGDLLTVSNSAASFIDKNAASGKTVNVSGINLSGTDAANYTFNTSAATTADITAKTLTVSATGNNKVYDGNTTATVVLADNRVSGDLLTVSNSAASFADKNAASGKTVTVAGINVSGTDAANYTFNTSAATSADITAKALTVSATGNNKVYDGNTTATVVLADNRISGDLLTVSNSAASFIDKNAASGKTVNVSGINVSGTDAGNYTFNTATATTADITAKALTVSATGNNKVYDGNTTATVVLADNRVSGDLLTVSNSAASFIDKNAASGKTVNVSGIAVSGTDAGNYTFNTSAATNADITAKALTVSATGNNKVYDGNTTATVVLADNRVSGDLLTVSNSAASFIDKNAASGKTVNVSGIAVSGTDAGNYTFNTATATTADITAKALTVSATGNNKVYDGNTTATVVLADNRISGDLLTVSNSAASFIDKNAASGKTVNVSGIAVSGTDAGNYTFNTSAATSADITAKALTVSATGNNKVYDGNTTATVVLADNRISGDLLTVSNSAASFIDKNAASGKTVNVSGIAVSGTDAGNYTFNTSAATSADITAKALTVSATGTNKVYDGNTTATVVLADNRVSGDLLTISNSAASFIDKNAASGKTVNVSGIAVSGTDAANYTFNTSAATSADITAKALTVSATGTNKVYDGNTTATVVLADNRVSGDLLTVSNSAASFIDKNAASGKTVNVSGIAVSGTDAGNYTFNTSAATNADITAKALTVSATGNNKVYDGNTTATVVLADNRVSGDLLTVSNSAASFIDKNAASGKTVNVSGIAVSGTDAGNYTFNTSAATSADITAKALTVSATGNNKVYDGNTIATVVLADNRISGDLLTISNSAASFIDKNAASGKTVNVSGINLSGTDAGNYTFNTSAATSADITAKALTVSATGNNKVYDGNTIATVVLADNRISGDLLTVSNSAASFIDKNAASGKTVNVSGIAVSGTDAGNYTFNTSAATTADITAKALTVSATGNNKVYDGNTTATVVLADNRISGDLLTISSSAASFIDKNAASGKTVNVSGINLSGTDAGNYTFNTSAATTADITAKALTVSATGNNKVYDGNTTATVVLADNRVSGDLLTVSNSAASFADKNAASGKTVTVAGINVSGTDAGNYTFNSTAATTANITVRPLSTWTAGTSGLWSDPANWDALPDGQNVLAVSIPSGGSYQVNYDGGNTTLQNLNSAQTLLMTNGNLDIGTLLNTTGLQQSGGMINGTGAINVTNSFNQSGGSINLAGTANLTQSTGNLNIAALTASTVGLTATSGAISQTGPIVASSLHTDSATGTLLTNSDNQVAHFSAVNHSSGDIALNNTSSPLIIAAVTQSGPGNVVIDNIGATATGSEPVSSGGSVSIFAHSPLTIGSGGVTAGDDIVLVAAASNGGADNLTVDGPVLSKSGGITLKAGDKVVIGTTGSATAASGSVTTTDQSGTTVVAGAAAQTDSDALIAAIDTATMTNPVAPEGLELVALAPQSTETIGNGADNGKEEDRDKDKDKNKDTNNGQEQQPAGGDKKDDTPKKKYCN